MWAQLQARKIFLLSIQIWLINEEVKYTIIRNLFSELQIYLKNSNKIGKLIKKLKYDLLYPILS